MLTAEQRKTVKAAIAAHPQWLDYRERNGISSTGALTVSQIETIAAAFNIDTGAAAPEQTAAETAAAAVTVESQRSDSSDSALAGALREIFSGDFRDMEQRASGVIGRMLVSLASERQAATSAQHDMQRAQADMEQR